jgi:hypothetical protein
MKTFSPNQTAMLLPLSLLAHQLEEYFGKFPIWYSNLLDAQLSDQDFLMINGSLSRAFHFLIFSIKIT